MSLVLDANLVIAIVLPLPYSDAAAKKMFAWKKDGIELLAPSLWEYEVTNALRKGIVHGLTGQSQAEAALHQIMNLKIHSISPSESLLRKALAWAERLNQTRADDAQYLALAEQVNTVLWTADQRLANGARQAGANWVYWVGES